MTSSSTSIRGSLSELPPPPVVVDTVFDSAEANLMRDRLILLEADYDMPV